MYTIERVRERKFKVEEIAYKKSDMKRAGYLKKTKSDVDKLGEGKWEVGRNEFREESKGKSRVTKAIFNTGFYLGCREKLLKVLKDWSYKI